jgi:LPS export ABC transporter protein LptC
MYSMLACSDVKENRDTKETKFPNSVLEQANIILTNEGYKEAVIYAETLYVFDKEDSTSAKIVKVDFFDENGIYRSTLSSKEGLVRQKRQEFSVWGDVVVKNDTTSLKTNSLYWDPVVKLIKTDDFVVVAQGADTITGYGMEADSRLDNIRILKDVQGRFSNVPRNEEELNEFEEGSDTEKEIP